MRLEIYLEQTRQTQDAFARKVGLTQGRISQIIRGGTNDAKTARTIERATGGQVSLAELLPPETEAERAVGAAAVSEPVARCPHCNEITAGRTECRHAGCELFPVASAEAAA